MKNYMSILKENGLKATFQRMHILEVIGMYGHKDVDEIYAEVIKTHPSISLATVYKNILIMTQNGVLIELPLIGRKAKYEIKKDSHVHLICKECGNIEDEDFNLVDMNSLKEVLSDKKFAYFNQELNIYGTCSHCSSIKVS
ncbi:putative peroxide stress regulator [Sulfurovum sp. enrichment culture clone C5]|uniref:Putative peroxide stress regulator n=1 Tax=Sulfurovum sp. enrichment culture clone C5 TaxID=497650 RepID=A0A0S4XMM0_9BACT|nr:putative peroxide stress regulator [Sulfurovum sp. enrichment culture clone C5]